MRVLIIWGAIFFAFGGILSAQSSIRIRNNSWLQPQISVVQSGTHALAPADYSLSHNEILAWQTDLTLATVSRDSNVVPLGDTTYFHTRLIANGDTAHLSFQLVGTANSSTLAYAADLPGQSSGWQTSNGFHIIQGTFGGLDITLKFRPDNDDSNQDRDVLFVLHQTPVYAVDTADVQNPNVLNIVNYNVQFLPFFIGGTTNSTRAPLIPPALDPSLDVIIVEEAFDPTPRNSILTPGMVAQGFVHNSGILNDYFPFNGGVIIYSRWPIETTDELDFALCGPNSGDCFANKGIMYARINKLGKKYHVFGTHMDAGSGNDDLEAKNLQYAEMRDFIAAQNIPPYEPALYGGDFNTSPLSSNNLYPNMLDSLNPLIPDFYGFRCSTMDTLTGKIIDYSLSDRRSLIPISGTNEIVTLRSIDDSMWSISDLSDHRTSLGKFVFPDFQFNPVDTSLCPGDNITLRCEVTGIPVVYQWLHNGVAIAGATNSTLVLNNIQVADAGDYACRVQYVTLWGTLTDPVNQYFYPNGSESVTADLMIEEWTFNLSCGVGLEPTEAISMEVFPNPAQDDFAIRFGAGPASVKVFDLTGREWFRGPYAGNALRISTHDFPRGVYFVAVESAHGRHVRKLILQ